MTEQQLIRGKVLHEEIVELTKLVKSINRYGMLAYVKTYSNDYDGVEVLLTPEAQSQVYALLKGRRDDLQKELDAL